MASKYIPEGFTPVEYQPSMVGIPTEAVKDYYNRMDQQFYTAQEESAKLQTVLATQIANAAEGDKSYLQGYFDQVKGVIDEASESKDFQNRVLQVRNMARNIVGNVDFQTVLMNGAEAKKADDQYRQLAMNFGAENIIFSGHDPRNFGTFGADGQPRRFQGAATKRPDYDNAMLGLFDKHTDVTESVSSLQEFINKGAAMDAYMNTPEGRVHVNDLSQQMFGGAFIDLPQETQENVSLELQKQLFHAGERKIALQRATKAANLTPDQKKALETEPVLGIVPGPTEGTGAADRQVFAVDDRIEGSLTDDAFAQWARGQVGLTDAFGKEVKGFTEDDYNAGNRPTVVNAQLTSGFNEEGAPLVQMYYKLPGDDVNHSALVAMGDRSWQLQKGNLDLTLQQMVYAKNGETRAQAPAIAANWFDPMFNKFILSEDKSYASNSLGLVIKRENGGYGVYNADGEVYTAKGKKLTGLSEDAVRMVVGSQYLKNYGING